MYPKRLIGLLLAMAASTPALAAAEVQRMQEDREHVESWNAFADRLYRLHRERLEGRRIRTTEAVGGYADQPEFYREVSYYDADSGRLLSRVQYVREHPDRVHAIEVYLYDEEGRVTRDYAAAWLPHFRNAPVQTLINLHHYEDGLHGFRQFDASGDPIYEFCEGSYGGRTVTLRLFDDDIHSPDADVEALMASPLYAACFGGLPAEAGAYRSPH